MNANKMMMILSKKFIIVTLTVYFDPGFNNKSLEQFNMYFKGNGIKWTRILLSTEN